MVKVTCVCRTCNKIFYVKKSQFLIGEGKYCSRYCRISQVKHMCEICGKEFNVKKSIAISGKGKFCSRKCLGISQRNGQFIECKRCGKEFYIRSGSKQIYCSSACTYEPKTKRICRECGKEFYIINSFAKEGRGVYCSRSCSDKNNVGPLNPNWCGGKSYEPYCFRFDEKFKEGIRKKFKRMCFLCPTDSHSKRLNIHHIDYNKNSICNGKEWAFLPLCTSHHSRSNFNRWYWFNLLINYWAMNPDIHFGVNYDIFSYDLERTRYDKRRKGRRA